MGNLQSLETGHGKLSKSELDRLERRTRKLGRGRTEVARSDLLAVDGLAGNPFTDRIFEMYDQGDVSSTAAHAVCSCVILVPPAPPCPNATLPVLLPADADRLLLLSDMNRLMEALKRLSDEEARLRCEC
jgi:hypothetical protein